MSLRRRTTWDEDISLPILIITPYSGKPKNPDEWSHIVHQGAGHACQSFEADCIILPIKDEMLDAVTTLTQKWLDTDAGCFGVTLREINEYSDDLAKLGLTCNVAYTDFVEGIYPFDCTPENLRKVTNVAIPEALDDLLDFDTDLSRLFGSIGRWSAYILGENCD